MVDHKGNRKTGGYMKKKLKLVLTELDDKPSTAPNSVSIAYTDEMTVVELRHALLNYEGIGIEDNKYNMARAIDEAMQLYFGIPMLSNLILFNIDGRLMQPNEGVYLIFTLCEV